jgi:adenine phosphoribosyltransferase
MIVIAFDHLNKNKHEKETEFAMLQEAFAHLKTHNKSAECKEALARTMPYFPFKGIERFYDIGGFLKHPPTFQLVVDVYRARYEDMGLDSIAGIDARGFVLGPPIALALGIPFFMIRKKGKMPNSITGGTYSKEYAGEDQLSIPRGAVKKGDRVLLIDDLVATGGTLIAAIELVKSVGGVVAECACVVEIKALNAREKFQKAGHSEVPIWAIVGEEVLTLDGLKAKAIDSTGYVDDGRPH